MPRSDNGPKPYPTIIGGGPAGFHAAVQISELGFRCRILDESHGLGGVIYRAPGSLRIEERLDAKTRAKVASYRALFERHRERIDFESGAEVLGPVDGPRTLGVLAAGRFASRTYDRLIVCTGCFERAQPFPGWTLPGVMTLGALQVLAKQSGVLACRSAILAGTGPLLLVAAVQLHRAGIDVQGVFESGRRIDLLRRFTALTRGLDLLIEGASCLAYLARAGVPVRYGWGIVEARGDGELREAVVAPYDRQWRPRLGRAKTFTVDGLGVEYGFVSRSQLTQLLGVAHEEDEESGWYPISDAWGRTSDEHIYVAGDGVGVDGAQVAEVQGRLAALACLQDAGAITTEEAQSLSTPLLRIMRQRQAFRRAFFDFSRRRPGLLELPRPTTLICRCEAVRRQDIDAAIDEGVEDLTTLKMVTRVGMGDCQAKMCGSFCADYLRYRTGRQEVGRFAPRFPLSPLPFEALIHKGADS